MPLNIGNKTYTCIRRLFIPQGHLKPYYTKDEVLKLSMNMELEKIWTIYDMSISKIV